MKISAKIIWISCIAVLAASLIGDAVILILSKKSLQREALIEAHQISYNTATELENLLESNKKQYINRQYLEYYFKSKNDDYNICIRYAEDSQNQNNCEEIYNHTSLDLQTLESINYKPYDDDAYFEYAHISVNGCDYIIFRKNLDSELIYYRVQELSHVKSRMEWLAVSLLIITVVLTAITSLALSVLLRMVFKPLQQLTASTRLIADGSYDQRLRIKSNDEIGQLGESFNKMAKAIEVRTKSLEESEMKKTLFMGNLTHELKTPMTAMSGYAQTLLSTKINEEQRQEALMYIHEECSRLSRLSMKMMMLLELENENVIKLWTVPISKVFESVQKSCGAILKEKNINLEICQHGQQFTMDEDLMTDALINLTDNAVKASQPGGTVILRALENTIEVQDFGRGIPKEEQDKILEPFYMVDKSRSRRSGGAGLGLALTALIVRKHRISMEIISEEGKGTTIKLHFV